MGDARSKLCPSAEYVADEFSARVEYALHHDFDLARTQTAYLEVAYFFIPQPQVAARGELYSTTLFRGYRGDSSLLVHRELAGSINVWPTPGLVFKFSFHAIDGNRFAMPASVDDGLLLRRGECSGGEPGRRSAHVHVEVIPVFTIERCVQPPPKECVRGDE